MNNIALVFPGQGIQSIGMLNKFSDFCPLIKNTFNEASTVLNYDLWYLLNYGPVKELNKTYLTQPVILTACVSIWRIWNTFCKVKPIIVAGHSLGEYTALVCNGCLDFNLALKIVYFRGKLMQKFTSSGIMLAVIGLDKHKISYACKQAAKNQVVVPSNYNSYNQIVISGHKSAVLRAELICKKLGAKYTKILPISVPSHCILMKPVAKIFRRYLEKIQFNNFTIPIIHNTHSSINSCNKKIFKLLAKQLYYPVDWVKIINYIVKIIKVNKIIEISPINVLTKFNINITYNNVFCVSINSTKLLIDLAKKINT
ncbi:MAG: ACP S-malonyltransferase [Candidatus Lightella neohaematopini]|nr:ACP S-malonyltransferase [Candidatus Lightella neohaematopini]MCV2531269.1 ACP S-malonyltransferase [Candidatus Lightella neohaematopini]